MINKTRRRLIGGIAAAATTSLWSNFAFSVLKPEEKLKVGVIHMGAISNTGWEYYQAQAWRSLQDKYPDRVEVTVLENVTDIQAVERQFRQLAMQGHQLLFGTTFSQYASMKKMAPQLPQSHFECCAGIEAGPNLGVFEGRHYEGSYLTGIAAGRMTKSNILGWVGAFPVPQVLYSLNAFLLGAQSVNPDVTLKLVWVNAWVDPAKEKDAVSTLVSQGADVISGSPNTPVQSKAARDEGVWSIGNTGDFSEFVYETQLASFELDWSPAHIEAAQAVLDGTWEPTGRWRGLGDGGFIRMSTRSPELPASVGEELDMAEAAIISGELKPFAGPITDQSGTVRIAEGMELSDDEIRGMNWLVAGVQGSVPSS